MKKYVHNEKGLTLIEVLATLVILGIVFVGFMNVFPQMTLFNAKTYTKLDTMNLARQEMSDIKFQFKEEQVTLDRYVEKLRGVNYSNPVGPLGENEENYYDEFTKQGSNGYKFELRFFSKADFTGDSNTPSLYKIHLIIKTAEGMLSSETYGYIEIY